jgi:hypothetical protein
MRVDEAVLVTYGELRAAAVGAVLGSLLTGAVWAGVSLASPEDSILRILADRSRCDTLGWVTIVYADGSQYLCTPTEQKPIHAEPTGKKPRKTRKAQVVEKVDRPAPVIQ